MKRGEIYLADLDPILGHEIGGRRFVVIVSNDTINRSFLPLVVVPLVDAPGVQPYVFSVLVSAADSGLNTDVVADCLQPRAGDQSRFVGAAAEVVSPTAMKAVEKALHKVFQV